MGGKMTPLQKRLSSPMRIIIGDEVIYDPDANVPGQGQGDPEFERAGDHPKPGGATTAPSPVNIFYPYKQLEDNHTNGLLSVLYLSHLWNGDLINRFIQLLGLSFPFSPTEFCVQGYKDASFDSQPLETKGRIDGTIYSDSGSVWIETKIKSGQLGTSQIRRHIDSMKRISQTDKCLILLTPDDSGSGYIKNLIADVSTYSDVAVKHLAWRSVYNELREDEGIKSSIVFATLVKQFRAHIQKNVFEHDLAGCIMKIHFGCHSGVYYDKYIDEMRRGDWKTWNTPREYKSLDGTGRKLMLYDRHKEGITMEVEVEKVEKTEREKDFPWTNTLDLKTLRIFDPPISREVIRRVERFSTFAAPMVDRNAIRNVTREEYREILDHHDGHQSGS